MNPAKLTSLLLTFSALMSFGCATSNPNSVPMRVEEDQESQSSDQDVPWEWQVLYWVVDLLVALLPARTNSDSKTYHYPQILHTLTLAVKSDRLATHF